MEVLRTLVGCCLAVVLVPPEHAAGATDAPGVEFFEKRVRPLLVERCWDCHSSESAESELRLDSLNGMLQGGMRGPAIVMGEPEKSLLVSAIRHGERLKMPPKEKLTTRQIADLVAWVRMGSPWPNAQPTTPLNVTWDSGDPEFTEQQRSFWAFQRPTRSAVPDVRDRDWVRSPIDAFILAQLEDKQLSPAPPADHRTLIRRATFDLTGLPPTPDEIAAFLTDKFPDAFVKVVDRLLQSPRYGERWGRHWLDVARYADSNGLDENLAYANAFRYRDYVVEAWNCDKPFDQFVREQIAGDLLPGSSRPTVTIQRRTATGFLSLGAKMLAEDDPVKMQMDIIDEQVDLIGRAFMGMTLGCARCHDHKFDPIPTADYYALAGIFKSSRTMENFNVVARWQELPLASREAIQQRDAHQSRIDAKQTEIKQLKQTAETKPTHKTQLKKLEQELSDLEKNLPSIAEAMSVTDEESPGDISIHIRGNHLTLGRIAPRGFLQIVPGDARPKMGTEQSGRLQLAHWLTDSENPLTARVIANRVWLWHFGDGLVRSPDNFGRLGRRPTHPKLLDWLAIQLIQSGWSLKQLHRTIMLSSTYQMSTAWDQNAADQDPENELWWRMNRRRLEAEAIRDALLAASGQIDLQIGGSLLPTANRAYVTSTSNIDPVVYVTNRRSIYLPVVRSALFDVFQAFDFADPSTLRGQRQSTTVAPQALFMMNSAFVAEQSTALTDRLLSDAQRTAAARIRLAYDLAYGRYPSAGEIERMRQFIDGYMQASARYETDISTRRRKAWRSMCRALLSASEFVYLE